MKKRKLRRVVNHNVKKKQRLKHTYHSLAVWSAEAVAMISGSIGLESTSNTPSTCPTKDCNKVFQFYYVLLTSKIHNASKDFKL